MSVPLTPETALPARLGRYELYVAAYVMALGPVGIAMKGRAEIARAACDFAEATIHEQDSRAPLPNYLDLYTNLY